MYTVWQVVPFTSGLRRPSEHSWQGQNEKLGRGLAMPDMSDRVPFAGAVAATPAMWKHAAACRQSAMESCLTLPAEEVERLDGSRGCREKKAREARNWADVLARLAVQPSDVWLTPVPTIVPTPAPTLDPAPALTPALVPATIPAPMPVVVQALAPAPTLAPIAAPMPAPTTEREGRP